jgi:hypothetical protein
VSKCCASASSRCKGVMLLGVLLVGGLLLLCEGESWSSKAVLPSMLKSGQPRPHASKIIGKRSCGEQRYRYPICKNM